MLDVNLYELDLAYEVDVLPEIFVDFSPANQKLMFELLTQQNLIEQFAKFYKLCHRKEFVMPQFIEKDTVIFNKLEKQTSNENETEEDVLIFNTPLSCTSVDIPTSKGNKDSICYVESNGMIVDLIFYNKKKKSGKGKFICPMKAYEEIILPEEKFSKGNKLPQSMGNKETSVALIDRSKDAPSKTDSPIRRPKSGKRSFPYNLRSKGLSPGQPEPLGDLAEDMDVDVPEANFYASFGKTTLEGKISRKSASKNTFYMVDAEEHEYFVQICSEDVVIEGAFRFGDVAILSTSSTLHTVAAYKGFKDYRKIKNLLGAVPIDNVPQLALHDTGQMSSKAPIAH